MAGEGHETKNESTGVTPPVLTPKGLPKLDLGTGPTLHDLEAAIDDSQIMKSFRQNTMGGDKRAASVLIDELSLQYSARNKN